SSAAASLEAQCDAARSSDSAVRSKTSLSASRSPFEAKRAKRSSRVGIEDNYARAAVSVTSYANKGQTLFGGASVELERHAARGRQAQGVRERIGREDLRIELNPRHGGQGGHGQGPGR